MKSFAILFSTVILTISGIASTALAASDATYRCKIKGQPDNVYKISNVKIADDGSTVPHIEAHRFIAQANSSPLVYDELVVAGFAISVSRASGTETLLIGNLSLEFAKGVLQNCNQ